MPERCGPPVMRLTSLRSKIFLLVGLILLFSAALVMILTQRSVTRTVSSMEEHAVHNVLNLLVQDSETRWGGFLRDKIATVHSNRERLMLQSQVAQSVLESYARQAREGDISETRARELAREWIAAQADGPGGHVWAFDNSHVVTAAGDPAMLGADISGLLDYKGLPLAASLYQDVHVNGSDFTLYRLPGLPADSSSLRYAHARLLAGWDWVVAVSNDAEGIVQQFERRRDETEQAIAGVLDKLRLAHSGFAFILAEDGRLISSPPAQQAWLFDTADSATGLTLPALLQALTPSSDIQRTVFQAGDAAVWRMDSVHFRPLGWTIVAAVPESDFTQAATALRNQLGVLLLLVLAIGLAVAGLLSLRLTRPLHQLSEFARALPEQDLAAGHSLPAHIAELPRKRPDEVGRLAAAFAYMDEQLREKVGRLLEETASRERLESELNIARDIQQGLLPGLPPPAVQTRVELRATMVPAREVGGDLYDYLRLPDGRLLFAVGDVSDKGMPAALFMAGVCHLIRALAETETDPAVMMTRINTLMAANNPKLMFVTLIVGVLDLDDGRLEWANAGHSPLCALDPQGALRLLEGRSGPACGVQEGLVYRRHETHLEAGDTLLGYTDGLTEAVGPGAEQYGESRLYAALKPLAGLDPATLLNTVLAQLHAFVQDTPQSDDITLLALRRPPT